MRTKTKVGCALAVTVGVAVVGLMLWDGAEQPAETQVLPVTINLVYAYQNPQWNARVEETIRRFCLAYPEINVEYEIRYEDEVYEDMLNKLVAREELGDVVQLKEPYSYAESGLVAPLPDDLEELVMERCELEGNTYAVAALTATTGIVYNKALFERYGLEPPDDYEAFLSLCQRLQKLGITPLGAGSKDLWHLEYWLNHFFRTDVLASQPDFLTLCAAGQKSWEDPLVEEMLTHLERLFRQNYVDEEWQSTPDSAMAYHLAEGEVAMVYSGPWLAQEVASLDPECELGWFYLPDEAGSIVAGESVDVYWAVTASCAQNPERYEAAVTFLRFFYEEEVYADTCAAMAGYSTLAEHNGQAAGERSAFSQQVDQAYAEAERHISAYIGDKDTPAGFEKRMLSLLWQLCAGEKTVAQVQNELQAAWEDCMEQEAAYE